MTLAADDPFFSYLQFSDCYQSTKLLDIRATEASIVMLAPATDDGPVCIRKKIRGRRRKFQNLVYPIESFVRMEPFGVGRRRALLLLGVISIMPANFGHVKLRWEGRKCEQ